jgi:hypothetical protein
MPSSDQFPDFRAHTSLKVWLSVGLTVFFCACYFSLQNVVFLPVRAFPLTRLDNAIPFNPRWVWAYQSVYLLLALVPWALSARDDLVRYARGFLLMSCAGFACFALFPVAGPRPALVPAGGMFGWLVWYDKPTNVFPSLHVALASYSVLFAVRGSRGSLHKTMQRLLSIAGTVWLVAIAYAAVATKQHYAIDIPAGGVLALFGFWGSGVLGFRRSGSCVQPHLRTGTPAPQNPSTSEPQNPRTLRVLPMSEES